MTAKEKESLSSIKQQLIDYIESDKEWKQDINGKIDTISRGIYGEEDNGVLGLLSRMNGAEKSIKKYEKFNWKIALISGIFTGSIVSLIIYFLSNFTE